MSSSIRARFEAALAGDEVGHLIYAVYDWFVNNRPEVDWPMLFDLGLEQINHAKLIRFEHPNYEIREEVADESVGIPSSSLTEGNSTNGRSANGNRNTLSRHRRITESWRSHLKGFE